MLHKVALTSLFLLCLDVTIIFSVAMPSSNWPTLGSSTQIKSDSRARIHDDNNRADKTHARQNNISCTTTSCRCKFFLWNFISYIKFKETTVLVKENTIEGLGGKRFVRAKPGSLLERWYPQLRANKLKTDGCFLCGHSFREHLEYWWWCKKRSNEDYSNFESVIGEGGSDSFHSNYVAESGTIKRKREPKGLEVRTSFEGGVSYVVPPFNPLADGKPKHVWTVMLLALARTSALVRLEDLIWLERIEYLKTKE